MLKITGGFMRKIILKVVMVVCMGIGMLSAVGAFMSLSADSVGAGVAFSVAGYIFGHLYQVVDIRRGEV
jgi:hypothetical protein